MLFFGNATHDLLTLEMYPVEDKLRVTLKHETAAEVAEIDRLAKSEVERRKKEPAKPLPKVDIAVPADAQDVEQTDNHLEFTVGARKAKAAVGPLRAKLRQGGWKEEAVTMEPMFGSLLFKKGDNRLSITYVDTGLMRAKITILAIGATIETGRDKPE
jgi:hypothetical protein